MAYQPNNPNGQATMANSEPVVIASDQSAVPVSDNGGSLTVDGTVNVGNFPATQPVSGTVTANAGTGTMNVSVQNASIPVTDNGGSLTVDGTVAVSNFPATQPVSGTVTANAGTGTMNVSVQNASIPVTDNGGSLTTDSPQLPAALGPNSALRVEGCTAHDAIDAGAPVKIGFQAETAMPAAVANGDRVNGTADRYGRQMITHIDPSMQVWRQGEYTTTQTGTNIWIPTTGNRFVITQIHITTGGTTAGLITLWGAATGTTSYAAGTDQVFFRGNFVPSATGSPGAIIQPSFPMFSDTTNDCLKITTSAAMTVYVQVYGYEITP